jgi:hypothetical protein
MLALVVARLSSLIEEVQSIIASGWMAVSNKNKFSFVENLAVLFGEDSVASMVAELLDGEK